MGNDSGTENDSCGRKGNGDAVKAGEAMEVLDGCCRLSRSSVLGEEHGFYVQPVIYAAVAG